MLPYAVEIATSKESVMAHLRQNQSGATSEVRTVSRWSTKTIPQCHKIVEAMMEILRGHHKRRDDLMKELGLVLVRGDMPTDPRSLQRLREARCQ